MSPMTNSSPNQTLSEKLSARLPDHTPNLKLLGVLLTLYLAQGLPLGFITQALPAILREYDAPLSLIGWSGLLMLPWALKFLWAPAVDRFYKPKFGQGRSWIIPIQLVVAGCLIGVSFYEPKSFSEGAAAMWFFAALFFISLISATHDIAADGLTTRALDQNQRPIGNAMQVSGYRVGLIIGGGLMLVAIDQIGWQFSFVVLALLVLINTLPIWRHDEPKPEQTPEHIGDGEVRSPLEWFRYQFGYFWSSSNLRWWLLVLVTYKLVDGLSAGMVKPLMTDMGASLSSIGWYAGVLGSVASLIGAGVGALIMVKLSRVTALWSFLLLQTVVTASYGLIAASVEQGLWPVLGTLPVLYGASLFENVAASMALIPMLSLIMDQSRKEAAGSDFTFQICVLTGVSGLGYVLSGQIAEALGYTGVFSVAVVAGLASLLPIWWWARIYNQ